ncbi:hypothetical protein [Nocardia neocaledoniensis]|uniref:hypothetical protein n=1 Tax=Nocardia neocaledoniensis TaxID=236511 RepID=UPI002456A3BA|nr:hypothetical protein [Nocardia neocaledoniensis]
MRQILLLTRRFVRWEIDMWVSLARAITRRPDTAGGTPIRYAGAMSAVLWAFVIVSAVEIPAVHLLIPWAPVRLAALALGAWGLLWMLGLLAAHHMYPHLLAAEHLRLRYLRRTELAVPLVAVRAVRGDLRAYDDSKSLHRTEKGIIALPVGSSTNVRVDLTALHAFTTAHGELTSETIAFWADDPRAAIAEIRAALPKQRSEA